MAEYAFKGYDNFVLENKIDSILSTKLDMNRYMTVDTSLTQEPGMIKKIHKYTGSGVAEDLDRGEGNTSFIDAEYVEAEYRVGRTQAQCKYYDDDMMNDPTLIDTKVKTVAEAMVNKWTADAIAEFNKTSKQVVMTNYDLADFAEAISKYSEQYESQEGLFFLVEESLKPTIQKKLGDYLKYTEDYIRTGALGAVLGVPVYTSKALPKGLIFMATGEAVTAFVKKDTTVEQDRDIDTKENQVVATRYAVIALTDETRCWKLGKAMATAATITTYVKATDDLAGACTNGAKVVVYINGEKDGTATVANNAWTYTASEDLVAGDVVEIDVTLDGYLPEHVKVTVAE